MILRRGYDNVQELEDEHVQYHRHWDSRRWRREGEVEKSPVSHEWRFVGLMKVWCWR